MPVQTGCCKLFYSSMWPMLWEGGWEWTVPFCRLDINLTPTPTPTHPPKIAIPRCGGKVLMASLRLGEELVALQASNEALFRRGQQLQDQNTMLKPV